MSHTLIRDAEWCLHRSISEVCSPPPPSPPLFCTFPVPGVISLEDCTLQNFSQAGIYHECGSSGFDVPVEMDNVIVSCTSGYVGIDLQGATSPSITNCTLSGNVSYAGSGIRINQSSPTAWISPSLVSETEIDLFPFGSGILIEGGNPRIRATDVSRCKWGIKITGGQAEILPSIPDPYEPLAVGHISDCTTGLMVASGVFSDPAPEIFKLVIASLTGQIGLYTDGGAGGSYSHLDISGGATGVKAYSMQPHRVLHSTIRGFTSTGILVAQAGIVNLGTDGDPGGNRVYKNPLNPGDTTGPQKYVRVLTPRVEGMPSVLARGNWWGLYPEPASRFSLHVDYGNAIQDDPGLWNGPRVVTGGEAPKLDNPVRVWPNPFRSGVVRVHAPGVMIEQSAAVNLRVFDLQGRRVFANWVSPDQDGSVTWGGRDEMGREVGSGMYLLMLTQGSASVTVRVLKLP